MKISNFYGCQYDYAAVYLNQVPTAKPVNSSKKERKVERVSPSHTGRSFNKNAGTKANHNHIDRRI